MTPQSGFSQASYSVTMQRSIALAIALLMQAAPAHSETLDLACVLTDASPAITVRVLIDTNLKTVTTIGSNGKPNEYAATMISDQFIRYSIPAEDNDHVSYESTIDRVSGTLTLETIFRGDNRGAVHYSCRRATQKF